MNQEFKIYTAGAGAGKTYALSQQILKRLWQSNDVYYFQHILAITFTNKAANEMKSRLLRYLDLAARFDSLEQNEKKEIQEFVSGIELDIKQVSAKSKHILTAILHNYSRLSISTIDKFNLGLIKSFSKELGVSNSFEVDLNVEQILKEAIDLLFDGASDSNSLLKALKREVEKKMHSGKSWDLKSQFFKDLVGKFNDADAEYLASVEGKTQDELSIIAKGLWQTYKKNREETLLHAQTLIRICEANDLETNDFAEKSKSFLGVANKIVLGKPPNSIVSALKPINAKDIANSHVKSDKRAVIESLQDEILLHFKKLLLAWEQQILYSVLNKGMGPLVVWNQIRKHIAQINKADNTLLISDFNRLISQHIQNQPAPFLYEKIGVWYYHYFIDEFQDTSQMQWRNFFPLLKEAQDSGNTAMLVGDVKQAIYSFRGGSSQLMLDVLEGKERMHFTPQMLANNYRSFSNIVDFNNRFYTFLNQGFKSAALAKQFSATQKGIKKEKGYVEMCVFEDKAEANALLLQQIKKAIEAGFLPGEMCILLAKNREIRETTELLLAQNYKVYSQVALLLKENPVIRLLNSLFLLTESQFTDEYLWEMWASFHEIFPNAEWVMDFGTFKGRGRKGFQGISKHIGTECLSPEWRNQSLLERVQYAVNKLDLAEVGGAFLQAYLDYIFTFQQNHGSSVAAFLQQWKLDESKLTAKIAPDPEAIQIMTLHKSKGLEFPVVFLPNLISSPQSNSFWVKTELPEIPFVQTGISETKPIDVFSEEKQNERMQREMDQANRLYVGTTRAVEQLYMLVDKDKVQLSEKSTTIPRFEHRLLDFDMGLRNEGFFSMGKPLRESNILKQTPNKEVSIDMRSSPWHKVLQIARSSNPKSFLAQKTGTLLHDCFAQIRFGKDSAQALQLLHNQGVDLETQAFIRTSIEKVVEHPNLTSFFALNAQVWNEREFLAKSGERFRPDRLVLSEHKEWLLLDYKTGTPREEDVDQVKSYVRFLAALNYAIKSVYIVQINDEVTVKEINTL